MRIHVAKAIYCRSWADFESFQEFAAVFPIFQYIVFPMARIELQETQ